MSSITQSTVRSAYKTIKASLEKAAEFMPIEAKANYDTHRIALSATTAQYNGFTVTDEGQPNVIVTAENIESLLVTDSERLAMQANDLVPVATITEIEGMYNALRETFAKINMTLVEKLGPEKAALVRILDIPDKFELSVGRKNSGSGSVGPKVDRDWSADEYIKGGRGKAKGWKMTVDERDEDGTPTILSLTSPSGDVSGPFGGWTDAYDHLAKEAGLNDSKTTNVPDFWGVPKVVIEAGDDE